MCRASKAEQKRPARVGPAHRAVGPEGVQAGPADQGAHVVGQQALGEGLEAGLEADLARRPAVAAPPLDGLLRQTVHQAVLQLLEHRRLSGVCGGGGIYSTRFDMPT